MYDKILSFRPKFDTFNWQDLARAHAQSISLDSNPTLRQTRRGRRLNSYTLAIKVLCTLGEEHSIDQEKEAYLTLEVEH